MTYPMDEETKEYIDGKFARLERKEAADKHEVSLKIATHRTRTKRIVYVCAIILSILALAEFCLLYWAQFSGR